MINDESKSGDYGTGRSDVDHLVESHLAVVGHVVREIHGRTPGHVDHDDLTEVGLEALLSSAVAWDHQSGESFARYASMTIRGALLSELRALDWTSRSVRQRACDIDETRSRAAVMLGRDLSDAELIQVIGQPTEESSLHGGDLIRSVILSAQADSHRTWAYPADAVATLPSHLRAVVEGAFFDDRTLSDIAGELGRSESHVRQLKSEALSLLREVLDHALGRDLIPPVDRGDRCAARRRDTHIAEVAGHTTLRERRAVEPPRPEVA